IGCNFRRVVINVVTYSLPQRFFKVLVVYRSCPIAAPTPTKLQKLAHNRTLSSESSINLRIIARPMRKNYIALDVRIQKRVDVNRSARSMIRESSAAGDLSVIER